MPPRKRPVEANPQTSPTHPRAHFQPFQQYLAAECGMSANTIAAYRNDLQQFLTWLESQKVMSILQVDLPLMSGYLQHLHEAGLAASSVARKLVALKMFFRYLILEQVVAESTIDLISSPKLWQYLPTVLSPEMVERLLTAAGAHGYTAFTVEGAGAQGRRTGDIRPGRCGHRRLQPCAQR